jgi:fructose-1,6-bisphosphatase I
MGKAFKIGILLEAALQKSATPDVAATIMAIAQGAIPIASLIRRGPLAGTMGVSVGTNEDGDTQKALDLIADEQFCKRLRGAGVRAIVSEEMNAPLLMDAGGRILVAMDPLDGSSNIDTNVSIGTIFSLLEAPHQGQVTAEDFLQPGQRQLSAGFVIYGPQVSLVLTLGAGVHMATLDPVSETFVVSKTFITVPDGSPEFAINASNYRHWHKPVQAYIDDCVEGADGPRGVNFNMRWIASLVADAYRILVRGGVFLYPADRRKGYESGRLRHLYEANPIAFLIEQAGGQATDGINRILDITPKSLHGRIPLVFGSSDKVNRVRRYHVDFNVRSDESPLFGSRGLLRG